MKYFINKIIIVLIFIFSISTSLGAAVTYIDRQEFEDGGSTVINGVVFNNDGSKMFISFQATTGNANFGYIMSITYLRLTIFQPILMLEMMKDVI